MPITEKQTVCVNSGFAHPADTTKQVQFDMSGITSNSPAVVAVSNASGTMAYQKNHYPLASSLETGSLANNATYQLPISSPPYAINVGLIMLRESTASGKTACVFLSYAGMAVLAQSSTLFTTTANNAATINIYFSAGYYYIQNKTGAPVNVTYQIIGSE